VSGLTSHWQCVTDCGLYHLLVRSYASEISTQHIPHCLLAQEDCARLTFERFLSIGRAPSSMTEPSVQLDLESGTIRRRTSDSRICQTFQTVAADTFVFGHWRQQPAVLTPLPLRFSRVLYRNTLTYLVTCLIPEVGRRFTGELHGQPDVPACSGRNCAWLISADGEFRMQSTRDDVYCSAGTPAVGHVRS